MSGWFPLVASLSSAVSIKALMVGAGGFVRIVDIADDDTMMAGTDTYGDYKFDPLAVNPGNAGGLGKWGGMTTVSSMPVSDPGTAIVNVQNFAAQQGTYEIRIAPSNSQIGYKCQFGYIYKTTNGGATWINTNASFTPIAAGDANSNDSNLTTTNSGPKMAIDPINPNIMYIGLQSGSAWATFDGGVSWTHLTGLPACTAATFTAIAIDRRTATQSGGVSTVAYFFVFGTGLYKSVNAGNASMTFTKITGSGTANTGLTTLWQMIVDRLGVLWMAANTGSADNVWKYSGTTLTNIQFNATFGLNMPYTVSICEHKPSTAGQRIVCFSNLGIVTQTLDGGTTWHGGFGSGSSDNGWGTNTATDIPYLQQISDVPVCGFVVCNSAGDFVQSNGVGVSKATIPTTFTGAQSFTWNSIGGGIEQLVGNQVIAPPNGSRICGSFDRAFIRASDFTKYPIDVVPHDFAVSPGGVSCDWASASPTTIVALQAFGALYVSSNDGLSWSAAKTTPSGNPVQCICAMDATHAIIKANDGNHYYTANLTATTPTWVDLGSYFNTNFSIAPNSVQLFGNEQSVCADRVSLLTAYTHFAGCVFRTQDGGASWAKMSTDGVGSGLPTASTNLGGNPMLRSVNGKAGHLVWSSGQTYQGVHPYTSISNTFLSTDGGATWADLSTNARDIWGIDTGPQVGSYPRIWGWGAFKISGVFQMCLAYSDDQGATWNKAGEYTLAGNFDLPKWLEADKITAAQCYLAMTGGGFVVRR